VAAPDAGRGEDLLATVTALRDMARQIGEDLKDDFKRTMKTSLFTNLRRDIVTRRELAQELVRGIRRTLQGIRTDVAQVGVQVEWTPKKDPDAQAMIDLISAAPNDETFDGMYKVLRTRMDEAVGEDWNKRVAHAFDYREWHYWKITITHANFTIRPGVEEFHEVTARSNPLERLSTGERRMVTMLPLMAAAWSMYSGRDSTSPRLVLIDEINATFDDANQRQLYRLMRAWEFDLMATSPSSAALVKKETGPFVFHHVHKQGDARVTVPWLWAGRGNVEQLELSIDMDLGRA